MPQGIIVLMNGTSSSGKTSIVNELMNQKDIVFQHLSVDIFIKDFFEQQFSKIEPAREVAEQTIMQIMFDPLNTLYFSTIKLLSEMGLNVIVDTVIENDKWLQDCLDLLADQPTLLVGIICSKEELARREQARGDRAIGLAASQFGKVYSIEAYDLEVNTETMSSKEGAESIVRFIKSGQEYTAFKKLRQRGAAIY